MEGPKKRVNKYGRGGRRALVHDLFDFATQQESLCTTSQEAPLDSSLASRGSTPGSHASIEIEAGRQLHSELAATWDVDQTRLRSPARKAAAMRPVVPSTMFEIESSEEEKATKPKPPPKIYKRRKVTPTHSDAETKDQRGRSREPMTLGDPNLKTNDAVRETARRKVAQKAVESAASEANVKARPLQASGPSSALHSPKRCTATRSLTLAAPTTPPRRSPTEIGSPVSDISAASMVSTRSATKRKREALDGAASDVSSPSQLELSSLRLTPQRTVRPSSRSGDRGEEDVNMTSPPKVRRRLIDRLETASPQRSESSSTHSTKRADHASGQTPGSRRMRPPTSIPETVAESPRKVERAISQEQSDTIKPRKYGKQRSHLRELGNSSSQESGSQSLEQLVSQVDALSNSQQSQFDIDMSDGEDDGLHLKSIHELRQAGAVNRFDRDLDSLLEDIASNTKALRISGLMQLVRKVKEQSFQRHVLEQGKVGKLTSLIGADVDVISASLMLLALWTLAHSKSITIDIMLQLYEGVLKLPPATIQEKRPLSKIARDREQNLSKALIRELTDFESHVLDQSASSGSQTTQIVISRIAIQAIEGILRRVTIAGESAAPAPQPWIEAAVATTQSHFKFVRETTAAAVPERVEYIRLILAWLELCEGARGSITQQLSKQRVALFAKLLAELLAWARNENMAIGRSCLKLAVDMCHQDNSAARLFASVCFSTSAFAIIEEHFPRLADKAVKGLFRNDSGLDSDQLDFVILALGALLELADSAEEIRLQMSQDRDGQGSQVDQLVRMFRLYVDETDEAIDESKTAILLPFGWISLLLGTLSLNEEIRGHISATIGRSFSDVLERATIFLERIRSINADAAFVERFLVTFESVKAQAAI